MTTDPVPLSAEEDRATPSGDLAAAAQHVADLYEMGAGGDDWWTALDHLVDALRSVSADSTAGLDVERLARAMREAEQVAWPVLWGRKPENLDWVARQVAARYAALSPSTPPEATDV